MSDKYKTSPSSLDEQEPALYQLHPYKIMMYFGIASLSSMFIGFSVAYLFSKGGWTWAQFSFPKVFLLSAVVLALSSVTVHLSFKAFVNDKAEQLRDMLKWTLILSLLFVGLQLWGWKVLQDLGIYLSGTPDGSYLYLLSGLHALHVLVGVIFLYGTYRSINRKINDPVEELLFFESPAMKMRLELIVTYWHFVDILWFYLLFFFLFNHL